jgi:gamma-glutamyltranspeptidase/glutathione hydrolase
MHKLFYTLFTILIALLLVTCTKPHKDPYQKQSFSKKGMVVSAHYLATEIGLDVLKKGGTAIDAAVAVHFALAVVYPRAGNLGGGGFLVYRDSSGYSKTLDFREKAPGAATYDMYLDSMGAPIKGASTLGGLASGIPGSVAGLWEMHRTLPSNLSFQELLAPAIALAEGGYRIGDMEANRLNQYKDQFLAVNSDTIPFIKSANWVPGDTLFQKSLGQTLRAIASKGRDGFYTGSVAQALVKNVQASGGIISLQDLASYQPKWREALNIAYKNYKLHMMPPPSSGGVAMGQMLKMIEPFDLEGDNLHHPYNMHLLMECSKRAFEDRAKFLGDPDFVEVPVNQLLDPSYLLQKMSTYDPAQTTTDIDSDMPEQMKHREQYETTHFSIVDSYGNAVAITTTINGNFGSKLWIHEGGFFMNNEMDDFSIKPGTPNMFGLVGSTANAIAPGKTMLSSMTPTIIEKNGELFMIIGSPGGPTIISAVTQVFLNVAEFNLELTAAQALGRAHHQWLPDEIVVEKDRTSAELIKSLQTKGHKVREVNRMGSVAVILRHASGIYEGGADPRDESHAQGL